MQIKELQKRGFCFWKAKKPDNKKTATPTTSITFASGTTVTKTKPTTGATGTASRTKTEDKTTYESMQTGSSSSSGSLDATKESGLIFDRKKPELIMLVLIKFALFEWFFMD